MEFRIGLIMKIYKIILAIKNCLVTPFHADTIFGHLCWVYAHSVDDNSFAEFLKPFKEGSPPFVISDGFPAEYLPKPFIADLTAPDEKRKDIKKLEYVSLSDFERIREGKSFTPEIRENVIYSSTSTHNTINRLTNTTSEGGLYGLTERRMPEVNIYLKVVSDAWKDKVVNLFEQLSHQGYGKKKSIGKGQFSIKEIKEYAFKEIEDANGFMTLSNFCPKEDDPTEGLYKTFVKYGKLGEEFAFCGNPFKRPLLMIKTGSVFKTKGKPQEYYGRMVEKISPAKEEAVQYAYAFTVPIRYPQF